MSTAANSFSTASLLSVSVTETKSEIIVITPVFDRTDASTKPCGKGEEEEFGTLKPLICRTTSFSL